MINQLDKYNFLLDRIETFRHTGATEEFKCSK